jgi:hypothetical protein
VRTSAAGTPIATTTAKSTISRGLEPRTAKNSVAREDVEERLGECEGRERRELSAGKAELARGQAATGRRLPTLPASGGRSGLWLGL